MYVCDEIHELHVLEMRIEMDVYDLRNFLARLKQEP